MVDVEADVVDVVDELLDVKELLRAVEHPATKSAEVRRTSAEPLLLGLRLAIGETEDRVIGSDMGSI